MMVVWQDQPYYPSAAIRCNDAGTQVHAYVEGNERHFNLRYGFLWLRKRTFEEAVEAAFEWVQETRSKIRDMEARAREVKERAESVIIIRKELGI